MGTSHRHTPSVAGEPNWGNASAAVTGIAGAENELNELEKELGEVVSTSEGADSEENDGEQEETTSPKKSVSPERRKAITKRQQKLESQIRTNYHKAIRNLVKAAGGSNKVSSGSSKAIGYAGVVIASGLVSAINSIVKNGLKDWLDRRGITSLEGKSCQDILDLIREYIKAGVAGLDNTAANQALESVLDDIEEKVGEDLENFDKVMSNLMNSEDIRDMLDRFFGMYIFCHLSQDFQEKLEYEKGSKVMNETMNEIKELIEDDIKRCQLGRDAETIDWNSEDGKALIQKEFDRIIYILSGNED